MPRPKKQEVSQVEESKFNFFTEADFNTKGEISSMVPSWSCYQLIEELEGQIESLNNASQDFSISAKDRSKILSDLKERKQRLAMAVNKPELNKDRLYKVVGSDREGGSLGQKISESMFTFDDMRTGIADATVELKRSTEPCIKLEGDEIEMAKGANAFINRDGKVSRDDAIRTWRYGRMYLDDMSNPEILRRK